jgi:hypothetical protein
MGLFDLPEPVWSWVDAQLARALPDVLRIVAWGGIGAVLSMGLYRLVSPQLRLIRIADEERCLKGKLRDESIPLAEGLASARRLLRLAAIRILIVVPATAVALLPVLFLVPWLDTRFGYDLPERGAAVRVLPSTFHGAWIDSPSGRSPRIELRDTQGLVVGWRPVVAPVPSIQKRAWWNALFGNPLGYLPEEGPLERIDIDLPPRRFLPVGPDWMTGWVAPFVAALTVTSLVIKFLFRIR